MATTDLIPREKETLRAAPPASARGAGGRWRVVLGVLLAVVVVLFFFGNRFATFYTDWLWYRSVGQEVVFSRVYGVRILLFFLFGATTFLLAHFNIWLTERISPPMAVPTGDQHALYTAGDGKPVGRTLEALSSFRATLDLLLLAGALAFGIATGVAGQSQWDTFLRFLAPVPFGETDPVFGRDLSFYVFTLPFVRYVQTWLVVILLIIGLGTGLVYVYQQGINIASGRTHVGARVRAHLSALASLILLAAAWGYYLDRFYLLFGDGRFPGAGYTDIHSRLPGSYLLMIVTGLVAVAVGVNIWRRSLVLPGVALGLWVLFFAGNLIVPYFQQRLGVQPSEASRETPYIARAIAATRAAYDLNRVRVETLAPDTAPRAVDRKRFPNTLGNVRLWEDDILLQYLRQRQTDRQYFHFERATFDRYYLDGTPVHVALATRDLAPERMEGNALTWQNLHLRYTHGYGVVVAALSKVAPDGSPELLVRGLPPKAAHPDLELRQPRIYHGLGRAHESYAIAGTRVDEFDYPSETTDGGGGGAGETADRRGIPLTGLNRLAFALRFATWSILLTQDLTPRSEILLQRHVPLRIKRLAPFLTLDREPYAVIANGRLLWVVDGYTSSATYPYAAFSVLHDKLGPPLRFNYVRGAVKATVDAYDGTTNLYAVDEEDPLLRSYQRLFPGLIQAPDALPAAVRLHQRYPKDLFTLQRRALATYHVEDPAVFYAQADTWSVPKNNGVPAEADDDDREIPPDYVMGRLPGEERAEYALLSALTPRNRDAMAALFVARCDGDRYGNRVLYRYPNAALPPGPAQALRRVQADNEARAFLFAANQRGQRVLFGAARVVLADRTLVYVVPVYVRTDGPEGGEATPDAANPPELRQVAVLVGDAVVLGPTLEAALAKLATADPATGATPDEPRNATETVTRLIERAVQQDEQARAALRAGDFAGYGEKSRALSETLARLRQAAARDAAPPRQPGAATGGTDSRGDVAAGKGANR